MGMKKVMKGAKKVFTGKNGTIVTVAVSVIVGITVGSVVTKLTENKRMEKKMEDYMSPSCNGCCLAPDFITKECECEGE